MSAIASGIQHGIQIWWANLVHLTLFNFLWLMCQILVIPGPPATAVMYFLVNRLVDGELLTVADALDTFRSFFVPAWKWALCNLVVVVGLGAYWGWAQTLPSWLRGVVSILVLSSAVIWIALNLTYWPLWLAQDDSRIINTFRNAFVLSVYNPGAMLFLLLSTMTLIAASVLTVFPLIHLLMVWIALLGTIIVPLLIRKVPRK